MKRNKFLPFLTIIFFAVLLHACSKKPVVTPGPGTNPPPATGKKLSKISYEDGSYEAIEYNAGNIVSKITHHVQQPGGTNFHAVYGFVYTGTVLNEIHAEDGSKYKYTYNNQQLVKTEYYSSGGNLVAYYVYAYKNGNLWKTDAYYRVTGGGLSTTPSMRTEQEHYANGNIKKITIYYNEPSTGALEKTDEYIFDAYDAKRNTSILFETHPYLPLENFTPNNPLLEQHYDANAYLEKTVTHSYTYDSEGNPLTRKTLTRTTGMAEKLVTASFIY